MIFPTNKKLTASENKFEFNFFSSTYRGKIKFLLEIFKTYVRENFKNSNRKLIENHADMKSNI